MSGTHMLWSAHKTSGTMARIVLAASGLPHETKILKLMEGEHKQPAFLAINPKGEVPALVLPDGSVITEGPAIYMYAAMAAPDAGLMPKDPAGFGHAMEWVAWCHWLLGTAIQPMVLPQRFTGGDEAATVVLKATCGRRTGEGLSFVEKSLAGKDFLAGTPRPTVGDYQLGVITAFGGLLGMDMSAFPNLIAHRDRIIAIPAANAVLAEEGFI